ncbi:FAD-binding oxidoreductase [Luteimonas sp. SJ-92]|uniref:FAD-binding oxidoreductase n=2 Tax=Luteimonas salinisoli TaxID=2752307 RepID=A0A853JHL5_9GAMM|nr:FAD-binding oxidoreductase [Luteimonas salinisoli]
MRGEVIAAGDDRMLLASKHFAAGRPLAFPERLLRCARPDDVRTCLEFLREHGLDFALRSGGHCFADLSSSDSVILDAGPMDAVVPEGDLVKLGPGALAGDVSRSLAAAGRAIPTGGCPLVAVGGLGLAGGFGFLGRRHGLTTDQIESMQVVTADGQLLSTSAESHPDLFWALRGAGCAGFAIVTSLTLRTRPLQPATVCRAVWPMEHAADVIALWLSWGPDASDEVNLEIGLYCPDDPERPCHVELFGVVLGEGVGARAQVATVRAALGPHGAALRTWELAGPAASAYMVGQLNHQTGDAWLPSRPYRDVGFQFTRSDFFDAAPDADAIGHLVDRFQSDRRFPQCRELELVPWGGAYARPNAHACFHHRRPRLLVRHTAMVGARAPVDLREHARRWVDASQAALAAHANGHAYQGYADLQRSGWADAYYGDAWPRLRQVKRRYDPDQVFRHAQSVAP